MRVLHLTHPSHSCTHTWRRVRVYSLSCDADLLAACAGPGDLHRPCPRPTASAGPASNDRWFVLFLLLLLYSSFVVTRLGLKCGTLHDFASVSIDHSQVTDSQFVSSFLSWRRFLEISIILSSSRLHLSGPLARELISLACEFLCMTRSYCPLPNSYPCKHFISRKALLSDFKKMKTIVRDIALGSRKWLPSGRNVPLRRHYAEWS